MSTDNESSTFLDLLKPGSYDLPQQGDRLFDTPRDASYPKFSHDKLSRHVHIWVGYMEAGQLLMDKSSENPFLLYPGLFCYRHALEIAMKWILTIYGEPRTHDDLNHHDLSNLWEKCKDLLNSTGGESLDDSMDAVEHIIKDFHDMDRGSFSMRYPADKKGNMSPLPTHGINTKHIKKIMKRVDNFFTGADGLLASMEPGYAF